MGVVALGPNGHRGVAGDHARRRPEAERCEGGDLGRQGERGGVREHPWLTRSSMARSGTAEEVGRRRDRARYRRQELGKTARFRRLRGVPARAARRGERGARGRPRGVCRFTVDGLERRRTAAVAELGFRPGEEQREAEGGSARRVGRG